MLLTMSYISKGFHDVIYDNLSTSPKPNNWETRKRKEKSVSKSGENIIHWLPKRLKYLPDKIWTKENNTSMDMDSSSKTENIFSITLYVYT